MTTYNFDVTQNTNFTINVNAQNSNGTYINLSGLNVTGVVKYQYSNQNVLFDLQPIVGSNISGLVIISGNIGTGVSAGQYPYNIRAYTGNYSIAILGGYFNVSPNTV